MYTVDPWKSWAWDTNHPQWSWKICVILVCSPYQWFHITPLQSTKNVTSKMCKYRLQTCWCFHWKETSVWISYCLQKVKMSTIKRRPRTTTKEKPMQQEDPAQPKQTQFFWEIRIKTTMVMHVGKVQSIANIKLNSKKPKAFPLGWEPDKDARPHHFYSTQYWKS